MARGEHLDAVAAAVLFAAGLALGACAGTGDSRPAPTAVAPTATLRIVTPHLTPQSQQPTPVLALTLVATREPIWCAQPPGTRIADEPGATCQQIALVSLAWPPDYLAVSLVDGQPEVQWSAPGPSGHHYDVYRATVPDGEWGRVASVDELPLVGQVWYAWRDVGAAPGTAYRYGVAGINGWGKVSPLMVSQVVTTPTHRRPAAQRLVPHCYKGGVRPQSANLFWDYPPTGHACFARTPAPIMAPDQTFVLPGGGTRSPDVAALRLGARRAPSVRVA